MSTVSNNSILPIDSSRIIYLVRIIQSMPIDFQASWRRTFVWMVVVGGDPRSDGCIATLACLALLCRRLLKLTSSGWLTFPNEPSLIRSSLAVPTVFLSGSYWPPRPCLLSSSYVASSRADRLLNSLKEFNTAIVFQAEYKMNANILSIPNVPIISLGFHPET